MFFTRMVVFFGEEPSRFLSHPTPHPRCVMPALLSPFVRLSALSLLSLGIVVPSGVTADPPEERVAPDVTARAYLQSMEMDFTLTPAGEVIGVLVHCTSDATDDDMALLRHFPKLEKVRVIGTEVHDAGLKHLKDVPELKELYLYREQFTDAGMAHLKDVKKLRKLTLIRAKLSEKGLEQLAAVKSLEELEMPGFGLTPAHLEQLKKLPNLQTLKFRGNDLTDADAKAFAGFPKLTTLKLGSGKITESGLKTIRAALPGVTVEY